MDNIIIWGACEKSEQILDRLSECDAVNIVAFGDNDIKKQGTIFKKRRVLGVDEIRIMENIDYILVSPITHEQEVQNELSNILSIPIYNMKVFAVRGSIDISGCCNAKCKWCATGVMNRHGECSKNENVSIDQFIKIYSHLRESHLLFPFNELLLYNWGEPFLNCDYIKIIKYLHYNKQIFSVSTNASVLQYASNEMIYKYCKTITFSMSGFSQSSYDKIHGFNFKKIKENVCKILKNARDYGFEGEAVLSYHVYKFNIDEIKEAKMYAESIGASFTPIYAYLASYQLMKEYLMGELDGFVRQEAERELLLRHVENLLSGCPSNYACPLKDMISINAEGNVELCCCCDKTVSDYDWGSVFLIRSYKEWKKLRENMLGCSTCEQCRNLGIAYWQCNNPLYLEEKARGEIQ